MSETIWTAIVGGVSGAIVGSITTLFAPWINWGIEKRRNREKHYRQIIMLARHDLTGRAKTRNDIASSEAYAGIKGHLSEALTREIEHMGVTGSEESVQRRLMQELADLEKKWGLV